jgi:hypothetical protein
MDQRLYKDQFVNIRNGGSYPIIIGAGGAGDTGCGAGKGTDSIFGTITSAGGGASGPGPGGYILIYQVDLELEEFIQVEQVEQEIHHP